VTPREWLDKCTRVAYPKRPQTPEMARVKDLVSGRKQWGCEPLWDVYPEEIGAPFYGGRPYNARYE
jgi:hypothetical protein